MGRKRHTPEQIINKLRQAGGLLADVEIANGATKPPGGRRGAIISQHVLTDEHGPGAFLLQNTREPRKRTGRPLGQPHSHLVCLERKLEHIRRFSSARAVEVENGALAGCP